MSTATCRLLVCDDARSAVWELGPLPPAKGDVSLLTWRQTPPSVDGGVPPAVVIALTRALCAVAHVGYVVSEPPRHRTLAWRWTSDPDSLAVAFDEPACAWWNRAQVLLLCAPGTVLSAAAAQTWRELTSDDWASHAAALADRAALLGVLRPGVDGDVAGLLSLDAAFGHAVLEALALHAQAAGVDFERASERAIFAQ